MIFGDKACQWTHAKLYYYNLDLFLPIDSMNFDLWMTSDTKTLEYKPPDCNFSHISRINIRKLLILSRSEAGKFPQEASLETLSSWTSQSNFDIEGRAWLATALQVEYEQVSFQRIEFQLL